MRHPYFELPRPAIVGHRGAAGEAPENTLPSFERAVVQGATVVETDVRLTRDGVPVLHHDATVDRTTDGTGAVGDLDLAALRKLDAGHRFTPDQGRSFPFRDRDVRVPTLEEALTAVPGVRFNLELKEPSIELVERVLDTLESADAGRRVLLTAENHDTMALLRGALGHREVRPAVGASHGDVAAYVEALTTRGDPPPEPMALQIPATFEGRPLATRELIAFAHRHGVQVWVWTINEPPEMGRLLDLGVDALVTDFPARLAAVVEDRASRPGCG